MTIRPFKPSDADNVFRLRAENHIKCYLSEVGADVVWASIQNLLPSRFINEVEKEDYTILVGEEEGELVAFVAMKPESEQVMYIGHFHVKYGQQGQGIGRQIMEYTEAWVHEHHPSITTLSVLTMAPKTNLGFYKKVGFTDRGTEEFYFPTLKNPVNVHRLGKTL